MSSDVPGSCKRCGADLPLGPAPDSRLCPACDVRLALELGLADQPNAEPFPSEHDLQALGKFGDYEILERVGEGGMGVVYKARQLSVNRVVALKMIRAGLWASDGDRRRFKVEAEASARLQHPNIAAVYEAGKCEDQFYFTMEYFGGGDLQERYATGSYCDPLEAARLVQLIARGVHHAHQRGVLHRDLKPANIMLNGTGEPKVTDFGLATLVDADMSLTKTNTFLGSPNYIAPELADNAKGTASAQSDVYGLGAILYFLLTTKPPFQGLTSVETIRKVVDQNAKPPSLENPQVPADLDTICLRCLEKEPGKRYLSGHEVADELSSFLADEPIRARPLGSVEQAIRWCRRKPALAANLIALAIVFVLGVSGITWQWQRAVQGERTARRKAYASDILLAHQLYEDAKLRPFKMALLESLPRSGQEDLRGFEWHFLYGLLHRDQTTIRLPSGQWDQILPSPRGGLLAVRSFPGYNNDSKVEELRNPAVITFWDVATGEALGAPIRGRKGQRFTAMAFSPDGVHLAVATARAIEIWHVANRQRLTTIPAPEHQWIRALAYAPDGLWLGSVGDARRDPQNEWQGDALIWDLRAEQARIAHRLSTNVKRVFDLEFSPDGSQLAASGSSGFLHLWDASTGELQHALPTNTSTYLYRVVFHPDPKHSLLVTAGESGRITLWNPRTGRELGQLEGHTSYVYGLDLNALGHIVSASWDNTLRLWDSVTGKQLGLWHGHESQPFDARFLTKDSHFASGAGDGTVKIWHRDSGSVARMIEPPAETWTDRKLVLDLTFSSDGQRLHAARWTSDTGIWDIVSGQRIYRNPTALQMTEAFHPSMTKLGVFDTEKGAHIIDAQANLAPITSPKIARDPALTELRRFAWSLDGEHLAFCEPTSAKITLHDGISGEVQQTFTGLEAPFVGVAFSHDGRSVGGLDREGVVYLWSRHSGAREASFATFGSELSAFDEVNRRPLFFSPDDTQIVVCAITESPNQRKAPRRRLYSRRGGPVLLDCEYTMLFSPNGHYLATMHDKHAGATVWNAKTLEKRFDVQAHHGDLISFTFSPNSRSLVAGAARTLHMWDLVTGRETLTLKDFASDVTAIAFSPDGRQMATGCHLGSIQLWECLEPTKMTKRLEMDRSRSSN